MRRSGELGIVWKKLISRFARSLTTRIFVVTALILASACGVTYLFIAWTTPIYYISIVNDELADRTLDLTGDLQGTTLEDCGPVIDEFMLNTGADVTVFDSHENYVVLPTSVSVSVDYASDHGSALAASQAETIATDGDWENSFVSTTSEAQAVSFSFLDSSEEYTLVVLPGMTAVNQTEQALGKVLPYLALVVLVISLLGAVFYSRYITRPILRLSGISQRMANLDFTWKCKERRTDEIGVLGKNLDEMSDRLSTALDELQEANDMLRKDIDCERELERQRTTFFSAASHELKTPITILKGQLSGMLAGVDVYRDRDKYLVRSLAVTNRMESLVQEMMVISRMERAGFVLKQETVNLSAAVTAQGEQIVDLAQQKNQILDVQVAPGVTVFGETALLGRALANLFTNAILYSPKGAAVRVRLFQMDGAPVLTVENGGAHIPEQELPRLFEAFYRVEASRNRESGGSGLGLYLVKMILDRHSATCEISNFSDGVVVLVKFP